MKPLQIFIPDELHAALKVAAAQKGTTMSHITTELIREYLKHTGQ